MPPTSRINCSQFFFVLEVTFTSSGSNTSQRASSWVFAWFPVPIIPIIFESLLARYFAAIPPAAPVLISVSQVPSITAIGAPVSAEIRTISAITVGSPIVGFSGWTFTIFTPVIFSSSRYAGIVLRSPL